jgi:hypothetical protein
VIDEVYLPLQINRIPKNRNHRSATVGSYSTELIHAALECRLAIEKNLL